jgi:hypothetical protein
LQEREFWYTFCVPIGGTLGRPTARIWPLPPQTVQEDWIAWLPADKDELFGSVVGNLEALYSMLSISLNEAFTLRRDSSLVHARRQVGISANLFARLAMCLSALLERIEEHSSHFGTQPNTVPLNPGFFRGETAQRLAKRSALLARVLFSSRSRYFHKLRMLGETVSLLEPEFSKIANEIAEGSSIQPGTHWGVLEVLHYDLNTCLRESTVLCKSFLCALPNRELKVFRMKLKACRLLPAHESAAPALGDRRAAPL